MPPPPDELQWLRRLRDLSHMLAIEPDVERLRHLILDAAIQLTGAERGFLVLVRWDEKRDKFKIAVDVARDFDTETLGKPEGKVSRRVVELAIKEDRTVRTTSEIDRELRFASSVQARKVLSILCVPMRAQGRTIGVIYLDHRFNADAFSSGAVPIVEAFADQAALAVETARLRATGAQLNAAMRELAEFESCATAAVGRLILPQPDPPRFGRLVGASRAMQDVYRRIEAASRTDAPALICGELGTGKGLVAQEVHGRSGRATEPFRIATDEAAVFGTETTPGLLGSASGTVFIDDVAELSEPGQRSLLRALQEGRVLAPDGSLRPVRARLLAATRHDLRALVGAGRFREDLYYRLDVLRVDLPPLRRRPEDITALLSHHLTQLGVSQIEITPKAVELLHRHSWPGNVRELVNQARRFAGVAATGQRRLTARDLSQDVREGRGLARGAGPLSGKTLRELERDAVIAAMKETGGNKAQAARKLGVAKASFYRLLDRHELR